MNEKESNSGETFSRLKTALNISDFSLDRTLKELIKQDLVERKMQNKLGRKPRPCYSITLKGKELLAFDTINDEFVKKADGAITFQIGKITEVTVPEDIELEKASLIARNKELEDRFKLLQTHVEELKVEIQDKFKDNKVIMRRILAYMDTYLKV